MTSRGISIQYELSLQSTADSTGFFAAEPATPISIEEGLEVLRDCPNDSFLHAHLLSIIGTFPLEQVKDLLEGTQKSDRILRALLLEAALTYAHLFALKNRFTQQAAKSLTGYSPSILIRSFYRPDQSLHRSWAEVFHANLFCHRPLSPPEKIGLSFPVKGASAEEKPLSGGAHLKDVVERLPVGRKAKGPTPPTLMETITTAEKRLDALDLFEGPEMRHQSSLSPFALMRKWRFSHRIDTGKLHYSISSVQTSYGRGLSLESARASCLMEVVERCSAFVSVEEMGLLGTRRSHPLIHGSLSDLLKDGYPMLDPNDLSLEVPYQDEPLYWMEGEQLTRDGFKAVWVPVQCVFLFCNLDERSLFSGLGSTGLASGNRVEEARLSALYEVLERDSEAVNPYHPSRCFRIYATGERMKGLFEDYQMRGIHVFFQDTSPAYGMPCCTCFVTHRDGTVAKGGGVNLDGKRAVLSALTEVPYPYPAGPPSLPAPPNLPWLAFEALPDFSTGIPLQDLKLVEETLFSNGYSPIYVDIARKDLDFPVVKALVPGCEMMADFDAYSRIPSRLFSNYLKIHG